MPTTPSLHLPYPDEEQTPEGWVQVEDLARATDDAFTQRDEPIEDPTAAAGWEINIWNADKTPWGLAELQFSVNRTGADITPNSFGNVTGDPPMLTLPAGWRPKWEINTLVDDGFGHGAALIQTDGVVKLRSWVGGDVIVAGRNLRMFICYMVT